jgi:hypothetical protein
MPSPPRQGNRSRMFASVAPREVLGTSAPRRCEAAGQALDRSFWTGASEVPHPSPKYALASTRVKLRRSTTRSEVAPTTSGFQAKKTGGAEAPPLKYHEHGSHSSGLKDAETDSPSFALRT